MNNSDFKEWLIKKVKYSEKSANDVLSRCRRVERMFNIRLDNAVKSEEGLKRVKEKLQKEASSYLKPGVNQTISVSIIGTAVKLYHKFINSYIR